MFMQLHPPMYEPVIVAVADVRVAHELSFPSQYGTKVAAAAESGTLANARVRLPLFTNPATDQRDSRS